MQNKAVDLCLSDKRITGLVSVFNAINPAVTNYCKQSPVEDIGVESFEFWCPKRRPGGKNIAMKIQPSLQAFSPRLLRNVIQRPGSSVNAWVANYDDKAPTTSIGSAQGISIKKIKLLFSTDYDNSLETVLLQNPETAMAFCANNVNVYNCNNELVGSISGNYLSRRIIELEQPVTTQVLKIVVENENKNAPASLFEIRCY